MKFPMRIFGEIKGFNVEKISALTVDDISPFEFNGEILSMEYEGPYIDVDFVLEKVEPFLCESCSGHMDFIDHENWEIVRCVLIQGAWNCKKINPDNVLEAYK
ncbi:MAG: hypothetical protein D5R98_09605 [Desulfonatronovibrio sp. MSAO_Bac4]|nr:MAG: hypothetical protein D5R98_09605 [Desulfonatronovibrio sp. MSAO_Bac4]